jgi:hypothetical protein
MTFELKTRSVVADLEGWLRADFMHAKDSRVIEYFG